MRRVGWRRLVAVTKEWGVAGILVAAVLVGVVEWNHFANDMASFRMQTEQTEDRLKAIETKLQIQSAAESDPASASVALANLDASDLKTNLPSFKKAIEHPVAADSKTLAKLTAKLQLIPQASPDYWPTVLRFIQFSSAGNAANLPAEPTNPFVLNDLKIEGSTPEAPYDFDRFVQSKSRTVRFEGGTLKNVVFRKWRIISTEKPVRMENVTFIDCVFEMPDVPSPNPYLRNVAEQLLASHLGSIKSAG